MSLEGSVDIKFIEEALGHTLSLGLNPEVTRPVYVAAQEVINTVNIFSDSNSLSWSDEYWLLKREKFFLREVIKIFISNNNKATDHAEVENDRRLP